MVAERALRIVTAANWTAEPSAWVAWWLLDEGPDE